MDEKAFYNLMADHTDAWRREGEFRGALYLASAELFVFNVIELCDKKQGKSPLLSVG